MSPRFPGPGPGRPDKRGGPFRGGSRRPGEGRFRPDRPKDRPGDRSADRPSDRPRDRFADRFGERPADRSGDRRFSPRRPGAAGRRSAPLRRLERPGAARDGRGPRRPGPLAAPGSDRHRWQEREAPDVFVSPSAPPQEAERFGQEPSSDLIWGRHPAQAALESERPIHRIWCTAEMRHSPRFLQLLREAKASGVLVEEVSWARLGQITAGAVHQGIVLQMAAAESLDLPTLIEGCRQLGEAPLLMAVDGLTDPHNLGAIVRSAESLGAHGLLLPQRRCAGLTGTVAKVAAGALEHLPVARVVNLNRALDALKQEGYRVVGLAEEGTVSLPEADLEGPLVVVTGSEGSGLSLLTRRSCDQLVRIPLRGVTPSLNASVATALLLYEVARRGWMGGLSGQSPAPRLVRPQLPAPAAQPPSTDASPDPEILPGALAPAPAEELPLSETGPSGVTEPSFKPSPEPQIEAVNPSISDPTLQDGPRFDVDITL